MAKRKCKSTPDHYCDCGARLEENDDSGQCISCRYHDGDPDVLEQVRAEELADWETSQLDEGGTDEYPW